MRVRSSSCHAVQWCAVGLWPVPHLRFCCNTNMRVWSWDLWMSLSDDAGHLAIITLSKV